MTKELIAYKNIDLLEDGDFEVRFVEVDPDEDGKISRLVLRGEWTPVEGETRPAVLTVDLQEEIAANEESTAEEILADAQQLWASWEID